MISTTQDSNQETTVLLIQRLHVLLLVLRGLCLTYLSPTGMCFSLNSTCWLETQLSDKCGPCWRPELKAFTRLSLMFIESIV